MDSIKVLYLLHKNGRICEDVVLSLHKKCTECSGGELIGKNGCKFSSLDIQENKTLVHTIIRYFH